jgi:hypothetical protein
VQDGARVDGKSRVGRPASFDQVGDVGLDAFEGLHGKRSPFDSEHAAVRDGGLPGAAADQGRVQVAWSEERVGPTTKLPVEVVEGDQVVAGGGSAAARRARGSLACDPRTTMRYDGRAGAWTGTLPISSPPTSQALPGSRQSQGTKPRSANTLSGVHPERTLCFPVPGRPMLIYRAGCPFRGPAAGQDL